MSAEPADPAKYLALPPVVDEDLTSAIGEAKAKVKEYTGKDFEIEVRGNLSSDEIEWITATGMNSLMADGSWDFLDKEPGNKRKIELWDKANVSKIVMTVCKEPEEYTDHWCCDVKYKEGLDYFVIEWYPPGLRWSGGRWGRGRYCWWNLEDEIVFGMQLYRLPGKCFYKSDWVDDVEDLDPDSMFPNGKKKYRRWLQFRHWTIIWYQRACSGWNKSHTKKPPALPDGSPFSLNAVLSFPSMPDVKMPAIKLPSLPDIEMPTVEMPDMPDMPSIDPSLPDAPSLGSLPSLGSIDLSGPPRKKRPKNPWAVNAIIEIDGLHAIDKGDKLILSDATIWQFYEEDNGHITDEKEEHQKLELKCFDEEQAKSWADSLEEVGCTRDEIGGCCTIA